MPVLLHADLNNFFASVELLSRPDLREKPVIVGGDADRRHGIVLAKNQIAKETGVKTAETLWQALQKCPEAVVLPPHHDLYLEYSRRCRDIFRRLSPRFESFGIDEGWIDLSESPWLADAVANVPENLVRKSILAFKNIPVEYRVEFKPEDRPFLCELLAGKRLADGLRRCVRRELGLTISVGISYNKAYAKVGSDLKKPDASTLITPWNARSLLWPRSVRELLFVGRVTGEKLGLIGVHCIGDLAEADDKELERFLGKIGPELRISARGEDKSPVLTAEEQGPVKSIGSSSTLPQDISSFSEVETVFQELAADVSERAEAASILGKTIRIWVRDKDFEDCVRQRSLHSALRDKESLTRTAMELFRENYDFIKPVRSLGLTLAGLRPASEKNRQMSLDDYLEEIRMAGSEAAEWADEGSEAAESANTRSAATKSTNTGAEAARSANTRSEATKLTYTGAEAAGSSPVDCKSELAEERREISGERRQKLLLELEKLKQRFGDSIRIGCEP